MAQRIERALDDLIRTVARIQDIEAVTARRMCE
jgi:hypothetical protein